MNSIKSVKVKDPRTGQYRIISFEEQQEMLQKGIFLDIPMDEA